MNKKKDLGLKELGNVERPLVGCQGHALRCERARKRVPSRQIGSETALDDSGSRTRRSQSVVPAKGDAEVGNETPVARLESGEKDVEKGYPHQLSRQYADV